MISYKKNRFFENRLNDSTGKPKELWKALKSLGLPSKTSVCSATALKLKNTMCFETKSTLDVFKNYYSSFSIQKSLQVLQKAHYYTLLFYCK